LTEKGIALGCVGHERAARHGAKAARLRAALALMTACAATPSKLREHGIMVNQDGARRSAFDLAAQPEFTIEALAKVWPELASLEPAIARRLEADAKYSVYLDRQDEDVARFRRGESIVIPADLDYAGISGLSNELRDKFLTIRPNNIGQAGRIEGMTPAALALVAAHARRVQPSKADRARN
jgi:tRNA uridine 5-carboxymethylaminomethyl modification enzyme